VGIICLVLNVLAIALIIDTAWNLFFKFRRNPRPRDFRRDTPRKTQRAGLSTLTVTRCTLRLPDRFPQCAGQAFDEMKRAGFNHFPHANF
jgi:hypothetical protein